MTVKKLITLLLDCPMEAVVYVNLKDDEGNYENHKVKGYDTDGDGYVWLELKKPS